MKLEMKVINAKKAIPIKELPFFIEVPGRVELP